jgi:hypothetical protein
MILTVVGGLPFVKHPPVPYSQSRYVVPGRNTVTLLYAGTTREAFDACLPISPLWPLTLRRRPFGMGLREALKPAPLNQRGVPRRRVLWVVGRWLTLELTHSGERP